MRNANEAFVKYSFASPGWLAAIHGIIVERAAWESKTKPNLHMSICEVFYNAPPHLSDKDGKIAWSCVIAGGKVDFQLRERDDVRFKVLGDYEAIVPLGRFDTKGDPARAAELAALGAATRAAGKLRTIGQRPDDADAMTSVHDAIARLTA
ncbi:MAG: hypothetical protein WDM86_00685 [Rhizomicrobium sp.]